MIRLVDSNLVRTIGPGWTWTAQPTRLTYHLEHETGLAFDIDAHQAETMSQEDAQTMAGAMAATVHHRVNGSGIREAVLIAVRGGARSCSAISTRTGRNPASVRNVLATMARVGDLRRESRDCYTLPG